MKGISGLVCLIGICVGSFLNVCIRRIPAGKSVWYPASHCEVCTKRLNFKELVPVFSYFCLGRKCGRCGAAISIQYPLVELLTSLLFLGAWLEFGFSWQTIGVWLFISLLVVAAVIDFYHLIIPNQLILVGFLGGIPLLALQSWESLLDGFWAALAASLILLIIRVVSRGGMGLGDVKLAVIMGLFLGPVKVGIALWLAFVVGGLVGIVLLAAGIKSRKDSIPFGPYLALGGIISAIWGNSLVKIYFDFWG